MFFHRSGLAILEIVCLNQSSTFGQYSFLYINEWMIQVHQRSFSRRSPCRSWSNHRDRLLIDCWNQAMNCGSRLLVFSQRNLKSLGEFLDKCHGWSRWKRVRNKVKDSWFSLFMNSLIFFKEQSDKIEPFGHLTSAFSCLQIENIWGFVSMQIGGFHTFYIVIVQFQEDLDQITEGSLG